MQPSGRVYRWPAEWEPHRATWIAWPHNEHDWPGKFEPIPWIYAEIVRWLQRSEPVHILVQDETHLSVVRGVLEKAHVSFHGLFFHIVRTNRCWTRDWAPLFVYDQQNHRWALKWRFQAWMRYQDWQDDDRAGNAIAQLAQVRLIPVTYRDEPVVLEGGAIDSNGAGIILATEECLLSTEQQRNPGFSREDYETLFVNWLGAQQTIWLARGIAGDDTHGHIDDVARFVNRDTILLVKPDNRNDPNYPVYEENRGRLEALASRDKPSLQVLDLPLPEPRFFDGQLLPASYANFYIANRVILVPTFNDPNDRVALNVLANLFPDRTVVGIYSGDLILGLGAIHCLTMQELA